VRAPLWTTAEFLAAVGEKGVRRAEVVLLVGAGIVVLGIGNVWDYRHDPAPGRDDGEITAGITCMMIPATLGAIVLGVSACKWAVGVTRREAEATWMLHDLARAVAVGSLVVAGTLIGLWWNLPRRHPLESYLNLVFCMMLPLIPWTVFLLVRFALKQRGAPVRPQSNSDDPPGFPVITDTKTP